MYFVYSILYSLGFLLMLPVMLVRSEKYASGFSQRLGRYPKFEHDERKVVWLHCVSVGETNAARPLVEEIKRSMTAHRLVVSTTTRTGQAVARKVFGESADAIFYFPFDFKFSVRRALQVFKPSLVLLTETEIWPNFIREASHAKAHLAVVNGRLSERSFKRYSYIRGTIRRVLGYLDLALMQTNADASRIMSLGLRASKVRVTGNLKFDHNVQAGEAAVTDEIRARFGITKDSPLIVAASTHAPEEKLLLEAFKQVWKGSSDALPRLLIAPRHPALACRFFDRRSRGRDNSSRHGWRAACRLSACRDRVCRRQPDPARRAEYL
jgi:3-deoxy-D-manno-octulosonic-acid transferase